MEASIIITPNRPKSPSYPFNCSPVLPSTHPRPHTLYTCRFTSTSVERALQIELFTQNKPNLQNPETNPTSYTTKTYTNIPLPSARKNKPNQTQLVAAQPLSEAGFIPPQPPPYRLSSVVSPPSSVFCLPSSGSWLPTSHIRYPRINIL